MGQRDVGVPSLLTQPKLRLEEAARPSTLAAVPVQDKGGTAQPPAQPHLPSHHESPPQVTVGTLMSRPPPNRAPKAPCCRQEETFGPSGNATLAHTQGCSTRCTGLPIENLKALLLAQREPHGTPSPGRKFHCQESPI